MSTSTSDQLHLGADEFELLKFANFLKLVVVLQLRPHIRQWLTRMAILDIHTAMFFTNPGLN